MKKQKWELDEFDSRVLGYSVAKIFLKEGTNAKVRNLIDDLSSNKIKYATIRVDSKNYSLVNILESNKFKLVDGLVRLELNIGNVKHLDESKQVEKATIDDIGELKKLTENLYKTSRILNDPLIEKSKANKFYTEWIENSVKGEAADSVLVWREKKRILGYVTLKKDGTIPLVGVSRSAQGKGIGKKLLKGAINKFESWKVDTVSVETQMDNIAAIRSYQSSGFKITKTYLTLRWSSR